MRWNEAKRDWECLVTWKNQPGMKLPGSPMLYLRPSFQIFTLRTSDSSPLGIVRPPIRQVYKRRV